MMLIGASLWIGILGVAVPKRYERYVKLLCGLCMIAILIQPLPHLWEEMADTSVLSDLIADGAEKEYYDEIYNQTLQKAQIGQAEEILATELRTTFSLSGSALSVRLLTESEEESEQQALKKAVVLLAEDGIAADPHAIRAYVEARLGCVCEIVYS